MDSDAGHKKNNMFQALSRLFGGDADDQVTEDEIISMVNEGHEQGVLDAHEAEMIQNIFEMDEKNAGDIMTHRKNIVAISDDITLKEAILFMAEQSFSRFPVYQDSIDNIRGILHLKDAIKFHIRDQFDDQALKDIPGLLRSVRFIPETKGIQLLFRSMQAQKLQMVIVIDEYGQTAGLVSMEDILEEIVGNIQDEYDKETPMISRQSDGSYLMDGMAPLDDVKEVLSLDIEDEDLDTLNGLLISHLDRILQDGEQIHVTEWGYDFHILSVENKMIRLVHIKKMSEEKE